MGPKKKENTGAAFEDRVSSLFWEDVAAQEEETAREQKQEQREEDE